MKSYTEKFKRHRKFLLVLPLLALPFVTLAFWALGGGQGNDSSQRKRKEGFNTEIPNASIHQGSMDKMSLYSLAEQNSLARREAISKDPYAHYNDSNSLLSEQATEPSGGYSLPRSYSSLSNTGIKAVPDSNELKVQRKLDELEKALDEASDTDMFSVDEPKPIEYSTNGTINRLEQIMQVAQPDGPDPEMQHLDAMLDKILDIEHPQRVQEKLRQQSLQNREEVFPVTTVSDNQRVSLLQRPFLPDLPEAPNLPFINALRQNGFYRLEQNNEQVTGRQSIAAVIHETQTVVSGATVKLRLTQDVFINGALIPKGSFVYGLCSLEGERLKIQVKNINYGNNLLPVELAVYDMDGLEGVHVPGTITRDEIKNGTGQTIQGLQLMSLDPSLATQAAGAGVQVAKNLLGRKAKLVRVTVKAGYPVLLVNQKFLGQ